MAEMRPEKAFCVVAIAMSLGLFSDSLAHAGAIVVSKTSPLGPLTAVEAERIFTGLQRTVNGQVVGVIFQSSGATREDFDAKVLGRSSAEVNSYMAAMIFTGRASAPTEVPGDEQVKLMLAAKPNSVGYIKDAHVDDSVKVLFRY